MDRGARVGALAGLGIALLAAEPAAARDFNCFEWVRASAHRVMPAQPVRHAPRKPVVSRRRPVRAHVAPRIHRIASPMVRRPIACPANELAMASPIPGLPPRETPADLDRILAGPPSAVGAAQNAAAAAPGDAAPGESDTAPTDLGGLPQIPGGVAPQGAPGPLVGFPASGQPFGPPPVVGPPVVTPPVVGPPVFPPPDTPPGPDPTGTEPTGTPSVVIPPVGPPVIVTPPEVVPPPTGPGPGPGSSAPEPGVWMMLTGGFGALGGVLRRRRAAAAKA